MKFKVPLLIALAGATLCACGSSPTRHHPDVTTTTGAAIPGQTLHGITVDGQHLSVSIAQVVDPARDSNGYNTDSTTAPRDHFATAVMRVSNDGNSSIASGSLMISAFAQNGAAYNDVGSDQNIVGDAYDNLQCASGQAIEGTADLSSLAPGETFTDCLAFILPESERVSTIEVSTIVGSGTGYNEWAFIDNFRGWSG